MGRKNTGVWNSIRSMCRMYELDMDVLYQKSRMLLSIYREACWSASGRADMVAEDIRYCCGTDLDGALLYLEEFAPDREREAFEQRVKTLFETRWMTELVEKAMEKVREFPAYGELYFEILSKSYLGRRKYTESELLSVLNMERSRFYDRKKEGIMIFGISMWGVLIPKSREQLRLSQFDRNTTGIQRQPY